MQIPLQTVYHNIEKTESIENRIREKVEKLEHFAPDIIRCRVTVEAPHKHHHKGNPYTVKIDVTLPGKEIVVSKHTGKNPAHEDLHVALRDAFDEARRQIEDYVRKRRDKAKHAAPPPVA